MCAVSLKRQADSKQTHTHRVSKYVVSRSSAQISVAPKLPHVSLNSVNCLLTSTKAEGNKGVSVVWRLGEIIRLTYLSGLMSQCLLSLNPRLLRGLETTGPLFFSPMSPLIQICAIYKAHMTPIYKVSYETCVKLTV